MSQSPSSPVWVSAADSHVSTLYSGASATGVTKASLTVVVPGGAPTGQVFNSDSSKFIVCAGACSAGRFLFATERGVIGAWSPGINLTGAPPSTHAVAAVAIPGASYKGLALATSGGATYLYAANFRARTIDVIDSAFHKQTWAGAFVDPALPAGYAPFNVALIRGLLYVSYAVAGRTGDDVAGPGHGVVDIFQTDGTFVRRLISGRGLNSPWGMAYANTSFGAFSGALLVGNFGDGLIHAYDPRNGSYRGVLTDAAGAQIRIDGLWGLLFGNGVSAATSALMYTSGPGGEAHGRFGIITANP
jgi:uncharacterized protein (TIGR03118 family)